MNHTIFSYDELFLLGWSLEQVLHLAHQIEKQQLGTLAYSVDDLRKIHAGDRSFCSIIFHSVSNAEAIGHTACKVITSSCGEEAQQTVSTCIVPNWAGRGYGQALDNRSEVEASSRGLKWRVARSWVGSDLYKRIARIDMGSPFNSANKFRVKQGFVPMTINQAETWFMGQAIRYHYVDLVVEGQHFPNVPVAEMEPLADGRPILLIFMIKKIGD